MAKTVEQLMAEFKIEGLDDKFVAALRTEVSDAHTALTQATTLKTEADTAKAEAIAERQKIDKAILEMGDGSLNATRLKAQNKALRAVVDSLKEDGLSIDLPEDIFKEAPEPEAGKAGAMPKDLNDRFATVGQAIAAADIAARYVGVFGRPMPVDMQTMVTSAARAGKTVQQWAEENYHLSAEMQKQSDKSSAEAKAKERAEWEAEYKKAHPEVRENPFMGGGSDSRFASMPKIKRENPADTGKVAGLSDMEKLRRAQEHGRQMLAESLQEK
jgi:hypothetical protein